MRSCVKTESSRNGEITRENLALITNIISEGSDDPALHSQSHQSLRRSHIMIKRQAYR